MGWGLLEAGCVWIERPISFVSIGCTCGNMAVRRYFCLKRVDFGFLIHHCLVVSTQVRQGA